MKKIEDMTYAEIKREAGARGVFKMGYGLQALKRVVQEHRDKHPDFVMPAKVEPTVTRTKPKAKAVAKPAAKKKAVKKAPAKKKAVVNKKSSVSKPKAVKAKKDGKHGEIRAKIMELMGKGKTPKEIHEATGYNMNTIYGTGQHYRALQKKK